MLNDLPHDLLNVDLTSAEVTDAAYDFQHDGYESPRYVPKWLVRAVGVDCFAEVVVLRRQSPPQTDGELNSSQLNQLPMLQELSLVGSPLNDNDLALLQHRQLRVLNLAHSQVSGTGLRNAPFRQRLRTLHLEGCPVSDAGLSAIGTCDNIQEINLDVGIIPPAGRSFTHTGLLQLTSLTRLRRLDLAGYDMTDDDLEIIAKLRSLQYLKLSSNNISERGVEALQTLPNLQYLHFENDYYPTNVVGKALLTIVKEHETKQ
ncbi:MAG: hypothetical protein ACKVP0_15880 [Pirellulaceae bacterium]